MKNILVTGAAGFIGSHLCKYLVEKGENVLGVDNLFTGHLDNIADLMDYDNFKFLNHDIIDPLFLERHIDQIYNFACPASPVAYQFNAIRTIKTNTLGMINMLGIAKLNGARILQASTSEVYGDPQVHPQTENYWGNVNCTGIRSCYDEGKRVAETLCFDYHRQNGVDIRIIRIFNTYGPNMDINDGRVVSNFIIQALQNQDITIYGDGSQTRSFCYVSDLVEGIYRMMNQDDFIGPVNLGNPNEFTIKELAEKVIKKVDTKSQLVNKDLPSDDPKVRRPNIEVAKEKLNWEPEILLDEGLDKAIEYFTEALKKENNK